MAEAGRNRILALLQDDWVAGPAERAWLAGLERLRGGYADSTLAGAAREFEIFQAWRSGRGAAVLPAPESCIAAYVDAVFPHYTVRTVQAKLEKISLIHLANRCADPTKSEAVRLAWRRGLRSRGAARRQAAPLGADLRDRLIAACPRDTAIGQRDRVLVRLAYDSLCRRSELVRLRLEDMERLAEGGARIRVARGKTDPNGHGTFVFVSRDCLAEIDAWTAMAGLVSGPILRPVFKTKAGPGPMRPDTVSQRLEVIVSLAGLDARRLSISSHSFRVGAAQDLAAAGCSLFQIMRAGRWRGLEAVSLYVRDAPVNVWAAGPHAVARTRGGRA